MPIQTHVEVLGVTAFLTALNPDARLLPSDEAVCCASDTAPSQTSVIAHLQHGFIFVVSAVVGFDPAAETSPNVCAVMQQSTVGLQRQQDIIYSQSKE
jgi:hypothetical protein